MNNMKLNVEDRTIFCHDNLEVLRGINNECIDLIYLDPPFNKNDIFTAPIGTTAEGASFSDIWKEEMIKDEWVKEIEQDNERLRSFLRSIKEFSSIPNYCYSVYMAIRVVEMCRILKDTGSIYYHCDTTMSHYIKIMLDCVFNENNFHNELIWRKTNSPKAQAKAFGEQHDSIFFYSKSANITFNKVYRAHNNKYLQSYRYEDEQGKYQTVSLVARGSQKYIGRKEFEFRGVTDCWLYKKETLEQWQKEGRIYTTKTGMYRKKEYLQDSPGILVSDLFIDDEVNPIQGQSKEHVYYPTQKPVKLLQRIIRAGSNVGDVVLDPFCGCATTCVAAELEQRKWIGIDISYTAYELVKERLAKEVPEDLLRGAPNFETEPPKRGENETGKKKHVYIISHPNYPNEYKVGVATNVDSRLGSYQIADPERAYKVEYSKATPHYNNIEKHIHSKFPNKGEWVQGGIDKIRSEIEKWKPLENKKLL